MNSSGKKIAERMRHLSAIFRPYFDTPASANELAFHLAEIQEELGYVYKLLTRVIKNKEAQKADIEAICGIIGVHWPYHIREAKRFLEKVNGKSNGRKTKRSIARKRDEPKGLRPK